MLKTIAGTAPKRNRPWVRVRNVYRDKGLGGVWFGLLSRAGYRRLVLLERPLDETVGERAARVEARVRPLGPDDTAAFLALGQEGSDVFEARLAMGHECWGAWSAGGLRHTAWIGFREVWVEYLACRLLLGDGVAYVYRSYTDPAYRRLGLGSLAHSVCLRHLQQRGQRAILAAVLPDNPWAYPPWLSVGYRRVGVVRAIGAGRLRAINVHPREDAAAPRGFRFVRGDDGRRGHARSRG